MLQTISILNVVEMIKTLQICDCVYRQTFNDLQVLLKLLTITIIASIFYKYGVFQPVITAAKQQRSSKGGVGGW